mmetsp:Transcript_10239/g.21461  ORF Transcript_10239/g.21461 Transcript_10239/m.21461 type:complete len:286 (+) Transcript_10239:190-1047(+)
MLLRINLPNILHQNFLRTLPLLLDNPIIIILRQTQHFIHNGLIVLLMIFKPLHRKPRRPILLIQIHEHLLLQLILPVINHNRIIMPIQPMNQCLNRRFMQMPNIRGSLPRLLPQHHQLGINQPKTIDDHLPLDRLNRIHHQRHRPGIQSLKRTLRIDIRRTQPAAEPGVGVIPPHDHLAPPRLLEHIEHFRLEDGIDGLDADRRSGLGHGEDVDAVDGVVVDELAEHEAHDFHGDAGAAVFEHFEEGEGGDVDFFGAVRGGGVGGLVGHASSGHSAHQLLDSLHG